MLTRIDTGNSTDFYPRSPCGERPVEEVPTNEEQTISIHALLAESDRGGVACYLDNIISIHALLAESDANYPSSTPPKEYFYPRSPCGERLDSSYGALDGASISIHALLAESDFGPISVGFTGGLFLSTLSLRRATSRYVFCSARQKNFYPRSPCGERLFLLRKITITVDISIHALLAESDQNRPRPSAGIDNFYPRSPCGERHKISAISITREDFYPRSPCGERQAIYPCVTPPKKYFYPRSPCGERQGFGLARLVACANFYPRSPCGERRRGGVLCYLDNIISIHALLAESDVRFA